MKKDLEELRMDADGGDQQAMVEYGKALAKELRFSEAFQWLYSCKQLDDPEALYCLGVCYYLGEGTEIDNNFAFHYFEKAAKQGYAKAQYNVGICYLNGDGVEKNSKLAFQWFLKAAEQGDVLAQHNVGTCYFNGDGVEKDEKEAFQWFLKAAEQGYAEAQYNVGICYLNGGGVEKNSKLSFQWFLKAAEQGEALAQYNVGICYSDGDGAEKDEKEAFQWFLKAAKKKFVLAQHNVGTCYFNGDGVEKNSKLAFQWFLKAAEQGYAKAQYNVGLCYIFGDGVEKNSKLAFQWFLKAAEQGHAEAQYNVGTCYFNGDGVEKDEKEAFQWFLKAAEQGYAQAQYNVGICYLNGGGVEKNSKLSFQWILKAAEQGDAEAQNNVGTCFFSGDGVEKNSKQAFQWFLKAAKQEYAEAKYNVGVCFLYGDGVEKDEKEAFQWFLKAAKQGYAEAQFVVGACIYHGYGVEKNEEKAYNYIFNAAKNGQFWAQSTLGFSFNQCIEYDNNNTNVLEKLQKQAEVGDIKSLMSLAEMRFWGNDLVPKDYKKSTNWLNKLIVSDSNNIEAKSRLALMNYFGLGIAKDLKKAKKLWQELGYSWDDDIRPDNLKELLICFVEGSGRNTFDTPECSLWDKLYIPLKRLNYSRYSNVSFEKFLMFCNKHHDMEPFPSISIDAFWNMLKNYEDARQILHNSKKPAKLLKAVKEGMRDVFEELCEEEDREFLGRVNVFFSIRDAFDLKYLEPWSIHTHNKDLLNSDFISYIFDSDAIKSKVNILNKKNNSNFSDDLWFAERTIIKEVASCIKAVDDVSGYYDYETRRSMNEILASPEFSEIVEYVKNENDETKDLCNESPSSKEATNTGAIEKAVTTKKKNGAPKLDKKKTIPETFSISDRNKMPITADDILKIYNEFTSKEHEKPILDAVNKVNVSGKGEKWFAYYLGLREKPNNIKYPQKFEWLLKTKYKGEEVMDKSSFIDFLYIIGVQEEQLTMPRLYNNLFTFKIDKKKFKSNVFTHIKNDIEEKKKTKDEIYRSERHDEIIERIRHAGVDKDKITPKNP